MRLVSPLPSRIKPEEQVLGLNRDAAELTGLVAREEQHAPRSFRVTFEHPVYLSERWAFAWLHYTVKPGSGQSVSAAKYASLLGLDPRPGSGIQPGGELRAARSATLDQAFDRSRTGDTFADAGRLREAPGPKSGCRQVKVGRQPAPSRFGVRDSRVRRSRPRSLTADRRTSGLVSAAPKRDHEVRCTPLSRCSDSTSSVDRNWHGRRRCLFRRSAAHGESVRLARGPFTRRRFATISTPAVPRTRRDRARPSIGRKADFDIRDTQSAAAPRLTPTQSSRGGAPQRDA